MRVTRARVEDVVPRSGSIMVSCFSRSRVVFVSRGGWVELDDDEGVLVAMIGVQSYYVFDFQESVFEDAFKHDIY